MSETQTLTFTGESPIVDTQSITQRVVMTAEVREALSRADTVTLRGTVGGQLDASGRDSTART